jgi:hypothetical protein
LLCQTLLDTAAADGYQIMGLDTGNQNCEALTLYEWLGFRQCLTYHRYPADLMTHLRFLPEATGPRPYGIDHAGCREHSKAGARPGSAISGSHQGAGGRGRAMNPECAGGGQR